jgi:hypothetical protein
MQGATGEPLGEFAVRGCRDNLFGLAPGRMEERTF